MTPNSFLSRLGQITNATKAQIIAAVNAIFGVLIAFHVALSTGQIASIDIALNAVAALIVALTFTQSAKRMPDPPPAA